MPPDHWAAGFFRGFHAPAATIEERRRVALHVILSIIGTLFLFIFGTIAFFQGNYPLSISDYVTSAILALNLYDLRRRQNYRFNIYLGLVFVSILYMFLYVTGGTAKTAVVWYYTYPLIATFLLGSVRGAIASAIIMIPVVVLAIADINSPYIADYSLNFEARFLAAYLVVGVFAYVFERTGEQNRRDLNTINRSLEQTVSDRTAELTQKNVQLVKEIEVRKKAEIAANLSRESLTTVMDSIDSTIYVADMESCEILFMNARLKALFDADLTGTICWQDLCGETQRCMNCVESKRVDDLGGPYEQAIWEGINPATKKWSINIDRTIKWIDGRSAYLHIATDISHLKQLEEERLSIEAQLQRAQKMEAIGTLAGGVAHDLNNVLTGLVGYPEMMLWSIDDDSPLREPLETIHASGKKAAEIVQDLLTMARRGVSSFEVVNLNDLIKEYLVSPDYRNLMARHLNIKVKTNLDKDLLNIKGSAIHLLKTIMNLVVNAAEAQPNGGEIEISTHNRNFDVPERLFEEIKEGDFIVLEVSDNGCGIAEEDQDRIFEPFYTKKVMGRSGTGLGMAVVWGTVQDHHGHIDIKSAPNEGATFYLYFPVTREPAKPDKVIAPIESYMGEGQSILIIDDIPEQLEIASNILQTLNYKVNTASSGEAAIEFLKTHRADMLLLDMIMEPGMNGLQTYRHILEIHPRQKAVIASGYSETELVTEALRLGAGEYIKKPYTLEKIGLAIKEQLQSP